MTTGKTAAELEALLGAELQADEDCGSGVRVSVIELADDAAESNWEIHIVGFSGRTTDPECMRKAIAAQGRLQRQYHLIAPD